jgi:uncharacterized Zn finger protein (UPF0148 family)
MKASCPRCGREKEFPDSPEGEKKAKTWVLQHTNAAHTRSGKNRLKAARKARHKYKRGTGLVLGDGVRVKNVSIRAGREPINNDIQHVTKVINGCPECGLSLVVLQQAGEIKFCPSCLIDLRKFLEAEKYMQEKEIRQRVELVG